MKNFLATLLILLIFLVGQSCKKSSPSTQEGSTNPADTTPLVTAVGTPVGNPVTKNIDGSGGTITSPDGVLKLIIPAGALSSATDISIQPVTNELPIGIYKGYSLTPNGQQFQTPVTLEFHYNDYDLDSVDAYDLTAAYQADDHTWQVFMNSTVDTINKTVTVQSSHFTVFELLPSIRINPEQAVVPVGKSLSLVYQVHFDAFPDATSPVFRRLTASWEDVQATNSSFVWAVNNIKGGNTIIGEITNTSGLSATYTAPAHVPNPSTVWVTYTNQLTTTNKIILRSKIRIIDGTGYHVKLYFQTEDNEGGSYFNWRDEGSFDIIISGNTGTVKNVDNPNANIVLDSNTSTCVTTLIDPPVGPINIISDSSNVVINSAANNITVLFNSLSASNYIKGPVWSLTCPGGTPTEYGGGYGPAYPSFVSFQQSNSEQSFVSGQGQYKTVITPIR